MELIEKVKYKKTEVGLIPEDWDVKPIGQYAKLINGRAYAIHEWETQGIPVIRLQNLTGNGENYYYSNLKLPEKQYCNFGDLLFMWSATFGAVIWKGEKAIYHYHIWKIEADTKKLNKWFLFHVLIELTERVKKSSTNGGTMLHVTKKSMDETFIPLPTLSEQTAIATALSDADALISSLEKLIEKKRDIKTGAMQKLLTPKKGWESKKLGEFGECIIGLTYSPDNVKESGKLVLRSSNVQGSILKYDNNVFVDSFIPEKLLVKKNDILICVRNGSRDLIGKCALIEGKAIGETFGAFMSVYRSPYNEFVFNVFQSNIIKKQIDEHLGATINQITNKSLNSFEIPFPPVEEQIKIVNILSDMNSEIVTLESKLDKYKMLKQGMMQNLLTGKIRLV